MNNEEYINRLYTISGKVHFGEIADNYSQQLISISDIQDMHFIFLVKEKHKGFAGNNVDYVSVEHLAHDLRKLNKKIDLWHSTDQLFIKRKHKKGMKNILTIHDLNFLHEKKG